MIKHKSQRVGVFIDVQNMYYSAKNLFGTKVDFGHILETAVAGRQLIRAIAYVVKATGEETAFFDALYHRGIETREREMQIFPDGARKADWDVGLAIDAVRISEILDVVILVTGDGDFYELAEYLKHRGRQVEVVAWKPTASAKLIAAADDFVDLASDSGRYLIAGSTTTSRRSAAPRGQRSSPASDSILTPASDLDLGL